MTASSDFTPRDFFQLAKEAAEHEAELKMKMAKAGVVERSDPKDHGSKTPSS